MGPDLPELLKRVRLELGAVRSASLMLANAQGEARKKHMQIITEKLKSIETLLEKISTASTTV